MARNAGRAFHSFGVRDIVVTGFDPEVKVASPAEKVANRFQLGIQIEDSDGMLGSSQLTDTDNSSHLSLLGIVYSACIEWSGHWRRSN